MPWSVNAGFLSRIINTRGQMGWDVPIVGQTTLGSGQTKALLEKPEYWKKVYPNNFRSRSATTPMASSRRAPPSSSAGCKSAKIEMSDTLLWWIGGGLRRAVHDGGRGQERRDRTGPDRRVT